MKKIAPGYSLTILISLLVSCSNNSSSNDGTASSPDSTIKTMKGIKQSDWGETDGKKVSLFTLTNKNGTQIKISNYGGTVTSWVTADKSGNRSSIVLGFDSLAGYLRKPPYF